MARSHPPQCSLSSVCLLDVQAAHLEVRDDDAHLSAMAPAGEQLLTEASSAREASPAMQSSNSMSHRSLPCSGFTCIFRLLWYQEEFPALRSLCTGGKPLASAAGEAIARPGSRTRRAGATTRICFIPRRAIMPCCCGSTARRHDSFVIFLCPGCDHASCMAEWKARLLANPSRCKWGEGVSLHLSLAGPAPTTWLQRKQAVAEVRRHPFCMHNVPLTLLRAHSGRSR